MSQNWKRVEDRICRQLGGRRKLGNRGSAVSDSDENVPFAVEVKAGYQHFRLPQRWIQQAKEQGKTEGKPWLLVQVPRYERRPIVTMDFWHFAELAQQAGVIGDVDITYEALAGSQPDRGWRQEEGEA